MRKFYEAIGDLGGGGTPKPYFAKYLPVEGEITAEEKNINNLMYNIRYNEILPLPPVSAQSVEETNKRWKKVKLFLCSRDIQVGDECYHIDFIDMGAWANRGDSIPDCVNWHGENVDPDKLFKVIGEISPDALSFVKEGDEFDEEQIQKWVMYGNQPLMYIEGNNNYDSIFIKIKGPCSHFH